MLKLQTHSGFHDLFLKYILIVFINFVINMYIYDAKVSRMHRHMC
jgi:hypothetical protein